MVVILLVIVSLASGIMFGCVLSRYIIRYIIKKKTEEWSAFLPEGQKGERK